MLTADAPIHTLGRALRARYGCKLRRISLDLGTSCPNRDGTSGYGGCIYCDLEGSGSGAAREFDLAEQWERGIAHLRRRQPEGPLAIAYLQSYSNTYPDLLPLAAALRFLARHSEEAPILAVGTRPDCFGPEAAALLARQLGPFREVWLELGLETADDRIQDRIGRHESLASFHRAAGLAREYGLKVVAHLMAGLPGDSPDGLLRQVREAARARVSGVKFHQLMVLRRTRLAAEWRRGEVAVLRTEDYVQRVADALEELPPEVEVHRLVASARPEELLAPRDWPAPVKVHARIENELRRRGHRQGWRNGPERNAPGRRDW